MTISPVIFLDQDGVLADFEGWSAKIIGPHWKKEIDSPEWGAYQLFPEMYSILPVMDGALMLYNMCCYYYGKDSVHVLTALPNRARKHFPDAAKHKTEWARKHINPDIRVYFGPFAVDKQLHVRNHKDILIDDMQINIDQWNAAGGIGILHRDVETTLEELKRRLEM